MQRPMQLGKWLGTAPRDWAARGGQRNIWPTSAKTDPIYAREGLGHPGLLQRVMNRVLVDNAILGPVDSRRQPDAAAVGGDGSATN